MTDQTPLSVPEWSNLYKSSTLQGNQAKQHELSSNYTQAFTSYLKAAQSYLFLSRHAADSVKKDQLVSQAKSWVERAEKIKKVLKLVGGGGAVDRLGREEMDRVTEKGGFINGVKYLRWSDEMRKMGVDLPGGTRAIQQPELSPYQVSEKVVWSKSSLKVKAPSEAGVAKGGRDIVQDNIQDCSLVAAILVAVEHGRRFGSNLVISNLFPQDKDGIPIESETGRHCCRFFVNGAWRCIEIDSLLPISPSSPSKEGKIIGIGTRSDDEIWPCLIEKAFMKLSGGYDFRGSNSSIDFSVLTGWIPEKISLRSSEFRSETIWKRLSSGFKTGRCVFTIGTGKPNSGAEWLPEGLVPSHNYAVIGMNEDEDDGSKQLELINPWRKRTESTSDDRLSLRGMRNSLSPSEHDKNNENILLVNWDVVSLHFDSLYINWDTKNFENAAVVHCEMQKRSPKASGHSTQFRARISPSHIPTEIWVLLTRHQTRNNEADEFVGMGIGRCFTGIEQRNGGIETGINSGSTMTDSPHLLYRFMSEPGEDLYSIDISHRGPSLALRFTLQLYSTVPLAIEDGPPPLPYILSISGRWLDRTAGGNHTCPTFMNNPQYKIVVQPPPSGVPLDTLGDLDLICATQKDIAINVKILRKGGERVSEFEERDLIAGTGQYSYGRDFCRGTGLRPGTYTIVVSAFQTKDEGEFDLSVGCNLPIAVTPIPQEGAGLFSRIVKGAWVEPLSGGSQNILKNPKFLISAFKKPLNVKIRLQLTSAPQVPIALSIFSVSARNCDSLLQTTGAYSDAVCGVATPSFRLPPSKEGYFVVPSTFSQGVQANFKIYLYVDEAVGFAAVT